MDGNKNDVALVEQTIGTKNVEEQLHQAEQTGKLDAVNREMAIEGTLAEHNLTTWQALKKYKKAALWSMLVSTCIIMRAYDIEVTGSLYAQPAFKYHMGHELPDHGWEVPTKWQVAMSMGPIVGQVGGAWAAAIPMDRFGRKNTLAVYLALTCALVFMQVFAPGREVLTASMYLAGFVWGGYHVIAPTYAAEVIPLRLRGFLTTYVSLCYTIGQLLQIGIVGGFLDRSDDWAWRTPYAIQWVWPVFIFIFWWWLPESPWWLIRQNRMEDAKRSLDALTDKSIHHDNANTLAMMVKTDLYERELELGSSYKDVFKGSNRYRLEICCILFITQNYSGNPVGFATYLFEQVGLSTENAFNMTIGMAALGFVATCICPFLLHRVGRRRAWLCGLSYCTTSLWVVALMSFAPDNGGHTVVWAQASILVVMQFVYALTVGPLGYVVSSETPSTTLRAKTLSVTATVNGLSYLILTICGPVLLNPGAANAGSKIQFLFGGIALISLAWSFFRLPEVGCTDSTFTLALTLTSQTAGRTYEELDYLFNARVPARKFRTTEVPAEN